ncbi:hypothetical protein BD414DRAFT_234490 [Trametes punicea]|nr:hypothetical protein BD414DRAFT_234490 [Trametes punicea]
MPRPRATSPPSSQPGASFTRLPPPFLKSVTLASSHAPPVPYLIPLFPRLHARLPKNLPVHNRSATTDYKHFIDVPTPLVSPERADLISSPAHILLFTLLAYTLHSAQCTVHSNRVHSLFIRRKYRLYKSLSVARSKEIHRIHALIWMNGRHVRLTVCVPVPSILRERVCSSFRRCSV